MSDLDALLARDVQRAEYDDDAAAWEFADLHADAPSACPSLLHTQRCGQGPTLYDVASASLVPGPRVPE